MDMIRNCGWPGYVVVLLAVIAVVVGIAALAVAALTRRFGVGMAIFALMLAVSVPAMGIVGTIMGRRVTDSALAGVDAPMRERIRLQGHSEAAQCTALGGFGGILPGLLSMGALLVAIVRRASRERQAEG